MIERATKVAEQPSYSITCLGNVVVLHWAGTPSMDALAPLERAFAIAKANGGGVGFGFLTIMEDETLDEATPNSVRVAMGDLLMRFHDAILATSIVYEGTGLKAFIVRGMITAINMTSRSRFPSGIHSSLTIGAEWLACKMPTETSVKGWHLTQLVVDLRIARVAESWLKQEQEAELLSA